jgi:regulatory protein
MESAQFDKLVRQCAQEIMAMQARREHSKLEILRKLGTKGFDREIAQIAIEALVDESIIDEARYTESYIRSRAGRGFGPERIKLELKERGISTEDSAGFLQDETYDWFEMALTAYQKKYGESKGKDFKELVKRRHFLMQRGFNHDQIKYAMDNEH